MDSRPLSQVMGGGESIRKVFSCVNNTLVVGVSTRPYVVIIRKRSKVTYVRFYVKQTKINYYQQHVEI